MVDSLGKIYLLVMDTIVIIIFIILMSILGSTLSSIFKIALYEYATTGKVPEGFSKTLMDRAVKKL